jgi:hypothetical protein
VNWRQIAALVAAALLELAGVDPRVRPRADTGVGPYIESIDIARQRQRVLAAANRYLTEPPQTVTASMSPRSAGGPHDFFSEGDNPAVELITALPSVWDETVVLGTSEIGEAAAFARRNGDAGFVAVVNGPVARTLRIDLRFLGPARYDALLVRDTPDDPAAVPIEHTTIIRSATLTADLRAGGGFIARLTPARATGDRR